MAEVVHERALVLTSGDGTVYDVARVVGAPDPGATTWSGWIEFESADGSRVLRTDRETTQSHREGLLYWATGLEPVYFEGALARAERLALREP